LILKREKLTKGYKKDRQKGICQKKLIEAALAQRA
jgi:hypothetical protein